MCTCFSRFRTLSSFFTHTYSPIIAFLTFLFPLASAVAEEEEDETTALLNKRPVNPWRQLKEALNPIDVEVNREAGSESRSEICRDEEQDSWWQLKEALNPIDVEVIKWEREEQSASKHGYDSEK